MWPATPPLHGHAPLGAEAMETTEAPLSLTGFNSLPEHLLDKVLDLAGDCWGLRMWSAATAGQRSSLRGVCRLWAERVAALCEEAHISGWWLPYAAATLSDPERFRSLHTAHVFIASAPHPHASEAFHALCCPRPLWRRVRVRIHLSIVTPPTAAAAASGWGVHRIHPQIDDDALTALARHCSGLTELRLVPQVAAAGWAPRVSAPLLHARNLQTLDLTGCSSLTDDAVSEVFRGCPALRVVVMEHCERLEAPAMGGPSLEELNASFCCNLRDDAVEGACARSPRLRALAVAMLPLAMGVGTRLRAPRIASASLQELDLSGCDEVLHEHAWGALLEANTALASLRGCPQSQFPHLPPGWAVAWDASGAYGGQVYRVAV